MTGPKSAFTTAERIKNIRKAELHRHIEGCVRVDTVLDIARKNKLKLPTFDRAALGGLYELSAPGASLSEVLGRFDMAQASFVSYEAVERVTCEALEDAYREENIRLLELRYSPDFMSKNNGLDWQAALDVIAAAAGRFEKNSSLVCGIIIIASRNYGLASAEKTAGFAVKNKKKVIGFDFADSESAYPSRLYAGIAKKLHAAGLPLTVHSGEEGEFSQVTDTINALAPLRIGHGVKAAGDPSGRTVELIKKRGITVETNPWSNYLTRAVPSLPQHPLKKFINAGVKCCIGADDPAILGTQLNREYALAVEKIGLSFDDINYTLKCALEGSFLEADKKQQAVKELGFAPLLK